jgi:hypothetical protein
MALKYKQRQLKLKEGLGLDKARSQASQCLYNLKKNNSDYESFKSLDMAKRGGYKCGMLTCLPTIHKLLGKQVGRNFR